MIPSEKSLQVIIVDEKRARAAILEQALLDAGYQVMAKLSSADNLLVQVQNLEPDVVIIDLDSPSRDVLENLSIINQYNPKPIVMFTEDKNQTYIEKAIKSGVSAYVVDGLQNNRVKPILDVAIARFREFQALRNELNKTRDQLADRKDIEKAKGLLIAHKKITEEEAYQQLRKMAMNQHQKIGDVARNVISILK